ncbi:MAG: ATP-binding protein, partial [bacterium]|nr:ATP-binding protein [bacterium]
MTDKFTFEISLSVLNHLGRNLYRSFATVLGEAISNSWDADANNVWIYISEDRKNFVIKDDGDGMSRDDFQNKFLKIGYSKRKEGKNISTKERPYIGRKGIGKLALLSCSDNITVIEKIKNGEYVGGVIDNSGLDDAIKLDLTPSQYSLKQYDLSVFGDLLKTHDKGTVICFENIHEGIKNSFNFLKKTIALYFRFSLLDDSFNIYLNGDKITLNELTDLAEKTEFLWNINSFEDPYIKEKIIKLEEPKRPKEPEKSMSMDKNVKGFIASVEKPRNLKITGMDEKVGVDLFVNGR